MNPLLFRFRTLFVALGLMIGANAARAQWQTQEITLKPGWNAVYLHVDASHISLNDLVLNPANLAPVVAEVWLWQVPTSSDQYITTPQQSTVPTTQWRVWDRTAQADTLTQLTGNAAYLVRNTGTVNFVWRITGRPAVPRYQWTTSGLNFLGFPTPVGASPNFDDFLLPMPVLQRTAEIYRYPGGDLNPDSNPVQVFPPQFANTPVVRGEAFWVRSTDPGYYNRYFGPVEVVAPDASGIDFSSSRSTASIRLKNNTAQTRTNRLSLRVSGTPPSGQPAIVGAPPLLVRGPRSSTDLSFTHTVLTTAQSPADHEFILAPIGRPGSEVEVVLGLNRSAMTGTAGQIHAAILRFEDTEGLSQIDIGVVAKVADTTGLWVGDASVTHVGQYLVTYPKGPDGEPILGSITAAGQPYVTSAVNTAMTTVARPASLRLIIHNDASLRAKLLQRVYVGLNPGNNPVLGTQESLLNTTNRSSARRLSAAHLPFSHANVPWSGTGTLGLGSNVQFVVPLDYNDQASNPFLHTFHPDHDNLDVFIGRVEARGVESYSVTRQIQISPASPGTSFAGLTAGSSTLTGVYTETITFLGKGSDQREFKLQGTFNLQRLSTLPTLASPP